MKRLYRRLAVSSIAWLGDTVWCNDLPPKWRPAIRLLTLALLLQIIAIGIQVWKMVHHEW